MKIYIGADHHGFEYKAQIIEYLNGLNYEVVDDGDSKFDQADDFPDYAAKVVNQILEDSSDSKGILLCGSGQGMCMAANRFKGIRAAICWDEKSAHSARNDDNSNVLCLSADSLDIDSIKRIIEVWLSTPFANEERFVRRINELDKLG